MSRVLKLMCLVPNDLASAQTLRELIMIIPSLRDLRCEQNAERKFI